MSISKTQDAYAWPPRLKLCIYTGRGTLLNASSNRLFDLADALMLRWPYQSRTVLLGISTKDSRWKKWDESTLMRIETCIRYDLNFDAYWVSIARITIKRNAPCSHEFLWKLRIRTGLARSVIE